MRLYLVEGFMLTEGEYKRVTKYKRAPAAPRGKVTQKHSCMGCDNQIPTSKTLCASCSEDMGEGRRMQ